jgi:alpha-1,3-mannosyltransferase
MEAAVDGLARAQAAMGLSVTVASPTAPRVERGGVRYVPLRRVGPARYPGALGLGEELRRADIVHVHGLDLLADTTVWRHPAVGISTHGAYFHHRRQRLLKEALRRTLTRLTLSRARAVWFTSASDRALLGVDGPVIGNGIDPTELQRPWDPREGVWVVPGRIDGHKGHRRLVEVMRRAGLSGIELRAVGPVSDPSVARDLVDRGVVVTGALPRGAFLRELATAERVVCPSDHEGFGIAALEAMAVGVPVVLSDIAAHRELDVLGAPRVSLAGQGAVAALRRAVDEAERWRVERRAAARSHGWDQVARRYVDAYRAML